MKILMVNKFLYPNGGSETYIFQLGKELVKMGHKVEYFGMEHRERVVGNRAGSYTSNMDFHTKGIGRLLYPFRIIYSIEARKKLRAVLEDFEPDVVHLNNFNFQLTPSIIYEIKSFDKKRKKKTRLVYTAHDYQWVCPNHMMKIPSTGELCSRCATGGFGHCSRNKCIHNSGIKSLLGTVEAALYKKLGTYRKMDTVICPSRFMERVLSGNPALAGKTVVLHNFVNEAPEDSETGKRGRDYVLYMGRYDKEKGIGTLLEVCHELRDIPFVFAGKGALEKELEKVPNIENKGFLSGAALRQLIRNARFLVFPSEWYENCPFTVMEAQMFGTPVLASDLGGTAELIKPGVTGELFEAGNAQELKKKIKALWEDEAKCKEYAENCGHVQFDTAESYCRKLLRLYHEEGKEGV